MDLTTRLAAAGTADEAIVVTADAELLEQVLTVCAAANLEPEVVPDAGAVRAHWAVAPIVIVGVDQAPGLVSLVLPRRSGVYVVGAEDAVDAACGFSVQLGAAVVVLPSGARWLASAMADASGPCAGGGRVVAVLGGSGGVGASTLAAGLAFVAARHAHSVVLVDADPLGGGLDLLVGAERESGWRWPRLAAARGHLGELNGQLPQIDGVDVLSMARGPAGDEEPSVEAIASVIGSAARSHELVVVDVGRIVSAAGSEALRRADLGLLVVSADVRGIAAGREMARRVDELCPTMGLVVRRPRSGGLGPEVVADGFQIPLLGWIADDAALAVAAERGEPPARPVRSTLVRCCRDLLDTAIWPRLVAA